MSFATAKIEATSALNVFEQTLAMAIARDLVKPLTCVADKTGKVFWVGFTNVISPDGRSVPVDSIEAQSNIDEIALLDTKAPNKIWPAIANFSYGDYGFEKIGNIWIDANNKAAVKFAEERLADRALCVIL